MVAFCSLYNSFHFSIENLLYKVGRWRWLFCHAIFIIFHDDRTLNSIKEDIPKFINIHLNCILSRFSILVFESIQEIHVEIWLVFPLVEVNEDFF